MAENARVCETLARWRNAALSTFADPTPVTAESTARWLRAVTADHNKKLCFVKEDHILSAPIGHIGVVFGRSAIVELGYVLRGESGSPGAMSAAVRYLLFLYHELYLKVLTTNSRAINFYKKLGFTEDTVNPPFTTMIAEYED